MFFLHINISQLPYERYYKVLVLGVEVNEKPNLRLILHKNTTVFDNHSIVLLAIFMDNSQHHFYFRVSTVQEFDPRAEENFPSVYGISSRLHKYVIY